MIDKKPIYLNTKQLEFLRSDKKFKLFIGGRGSGKSRVNGNEEYQCVTTMPRGKGMLGAATLDIIYNKALPSMQEAWEKLGLRKHTTRMPGHYVIGKKPPTHWPTPYNPPELFDNVISWSNGSCTELISLYNKNAGRGGNYQWVSIDEAALIDQDIFSKSIMPARRGSYHKVARIKVPTRVKVPWGKCVNQGGQWYWLAPFKDNPRYNSVRLYTTMPWLRSAYWLFDLKESEKWKYMESTAYDNIEALGPDYIPELRETLTDLVFRVEVMNERIDSVENSFYPYFDEGTHTFIEEMKRSNEPLDIGLDFQAGFICMVVGQMINGTYYIFDVLYVKGNLLVEDLIAKFATKYKRHDHKLVNIYGDQSGKNRSVTSKETAYEVMEKILNKLGWQYYRPDTGLNPNHKEKHEVINNGLKESIGSPLPRLRIHKHKCKSLIMSIHASGITMDFRKDKSSENKKSIPAEQATHLSDAFDYLYYHKFKHLGIYGSSEGEYYIG